MKLVLIARQTISTLAQLMLMIALLAPTNAAVANTFLETLEYRQQQAYIKAAPTGDDPQLQIPGMPLVVAPVTNGIEEESALSATAKRESAPISLEEKIEQQITTGELTQFGYDLFQSTPTTFAQVNDIPVPATYRIGPGDNLIVQLFGKRNVEYSLTVTRDGNLLIPEIGPRSVSGLTFDEAKLAIQTVFDEQVIGARVTVTMGELKTIQVRIAGEASYPGNYTVSGLATIIEALLSSGGVKTSGSLRNIQLRRANKTLITLDLYDLLMKGDTTLDVALKHNDVIFIPPIGGVVFVSGKVQRPAIYELTSETSLSQVLALAGGLLPEASIQASHIERVIAGSYKTLIDLKAANGATNSIPNLRILAGDYLRVLPVADTMDNVVLLSGHVKRPGGYQWQPELRLRDLIVSREQILPETDLDVAMLLRETPGSRRIEPVFIDLVHALRFANSEHNIQLQPRDELRLFNLAPKRSETLEGLVGKLKLQASSYYPQYTAKIKGHARYQGEFPLEKQSRLLDFLRIGGGILPGTDMGYTMIASVVQSSGVVSMKSYSLALAQQAPTTDANPIIAPKDTLYLFNDQLDRSALMKDDMAAMQRQSNYVDDELLVRANGLVNHDGDYPLEKAMRASDLVCAAGGLKQKAFGLQAELSRYQVIDGDRRQLDHILLDVEQLLRKCKRRAEAGLNQQQSNINDQLEAFGTLTSNGAITEVSDLVNAVRFNSGNANISIDVIENLREAMDYYRQFDSELKLVLTGHTDNQGMSAATAAKYGNNQGLSEARAWQVAEVLMSALNVKRSQINIVGKGAAEPIAANYNASGRALNRRVEISLSFTTNNLPPAGQQARSNNVANAQHPKLASDTLNDAQDPLLQPHDQLTFVEKPNWIQKATVTLKGEVVRPGLYVIDRGETLCHVMARAGGVTPEAYVFGAYFSRTSIRTMQQKTLDNIQAQLDDILVQLSMSHSARNAEKTPAGDSKDEYLRIIKQLEKAKPNGRMVINLAKGMNCGSQANIVLENGDELSVPLMPNFVNVAGQVYVPTSHMYHKDRKAEDYIELSGGATVIGRVKDAYIIQANGEVFSNTKRRSSKKILRKKVQPGAEVVVPLNLDRMNTTERTQSWTRSLLETALFAGIVF